MEFACGLRAFRMFRKDHNTLKQLGRLFSSHPDELPRLADKLLAENATLKRDNSHLQEQVIELEASNLLESADKFGGVALVRQIYSGRSLETVKLLAQKVAAQGRAVAILAMAGAGKGQVVVARAAGVPGSAGSCVKEVALKLGGKGGGRPEFAQAGGIAKDVLEDWTQAVADAFRTAPPA